MPDPKTTPTNHPLWRMKLLLLRAILVVSGLAMTAIVFCQVLFRYLLDISVYGMEDLVAYIAVWFYFIGAAHGGATRTHISASLIDLLLKSPRSLACMKILTTGVALGLCAVMFWWSWGYLAFNFKLGARARELGAPLWPVHLAMTLGLALMAFYFLLELVDHVRTAFGLAPLFVDEETQRRGEVEGRGAV